MMLDIMMIQILFSPIRMITYLLIGVGLYVVLPSDSSCQDCSEKKEYEDENRITLGKAAVYAGVVYAFCVFYFGEISFAVLLIGLFFAIIGGIGGLLLATPTELFYRGVLLSVLEEKTNFVIANLVQAIAMAGVFGFSAFNFMSENQVERDFGIILFGVMAGAFVYSCLLAVLNKYVGNSSIVLGILISGCIASMFIIHYVVRLLDGFSLFPSGLG